MNKIEVKNEIITIWKKSYNERRKELRMGTIKNMM